MYFVRSGSVFFLELVCRMKAVFGNIFLKDFIVAGGCFATQAL